MPKELLVVDDEPSVCAALKALFEGRGFRVTTASTAQAALEQLQQTSAEVVLLDLRLPDGSGLDLLSQMKHRVPTLRVIVISGMGDQDTIHEALERGASDFLTKPFDFARCFYTAMGIESVDLAAVEPDADAMARMPVQAAQQYQAVPLRFQNGVLAIGLSDPLDVQLLDEIQTVLGCPVKPSAVIAGSIPETIRRCYGVGAGVTSRATAPAKTPPSLADASPRGPEEAAGIVQLINQLIAHAHANRASDLHVGIGAKGPWIQERVDGILYDVPVSPQLGTLYTSMVSRMKVMATLDIAEHRLPQDGRIWFDHEKTKLDLRISVLPTLHGESLVIRLLEPSQILQLDQLGLTKPQLVQLAALLTKPTGLILVTGPTGSGKSTSLYAFLSKLNTGKTSIVTIEDPIEHELPKVTQIQVQPKIGLGFATGLRSMLRHDPDIVMVGEIRDEETANLAVSAALTGHLVLSTLHTNDAASGITRLFDLGIEPFLLCSTLSGILSQRLIRVLCGECRESVQADAGSLGALGISTPPKSGPVQLWKGKGCKTCHGTGYYGRTGVFELLPVDHHVRSLLIKRTSSAQIRQSAIAQGMSSLWQSGWQKMQAGQTSLEELVRVLPQELR